MCCLIHVFLSSGAINPPPFPPNMHTHTQTASFLHPPLPPQFLTFPAELGDWGNAQEAESGWKGCVCVGGGRRSGGVGRGRDCGALSLTMIGRRLCSLWEAWQRLLVLSPRVHRWFTSSPRNSFSRDRTNREVGQDGRKKERVVI